MDIVPHSSHAARSTRHATARRQRLRGANCTASRQPHAERRYDRNAWVATQPLTIDSTTSAPSRARIPGQSGDVDMALLAASTPHATGLTRDTARIHPGIRSLAMNTGDRNVIGSRMKFDAPITDSVRRTISAMALDSAPKGTPTSTPAASSTSIPTMPPSKRAPMSRLSTRRIDV